MLPVNCGCSCVAILKRFEKFADTPLSGGRSKALAILTCPGCSHRLRIPDNKRGTVTCPLCGSEWFHPEIIELSSIEFRCSTSGAKFNVIGSRRSPLHKFTVQKVEKAVPKATGPFENGSPKSSPQPEQRNAPQALPPAAPGVVVGADSRAQNG